VLRKLELWLNQFFSEDSNLKEMFEPIDLIQIKWKYFLNNNKVDLVTAEKQEHVLFIKMTKKQDKIYQKFLNSEAVKRVITGDAVCFTVLQAMVCLVVN